MSNAVMEHATKQPTVEPRLLTERDAARYIAMSVSFLRLARMEGNRAGRTPGPPFIRIGRAVRYDLRDLDEWLGRHRVEL